MSARKDGQPRKYPRKYPYGVTWRQRRKPWIVKFRRNKMQYHVGTYLTLEEAAIAAKQFLDSK